MSGSNTRKLYTEEDVRPLVEALERCRDAFKVGGVKNPIATFKAADAGLAAFDSAGVEFDEAVERAAAAHPWRFVNFADEAIAKRQQIEVARQGLAAAFGEDA